MILFGFKGCGKTHFGKLVAKRLHIPFIDTDALIEQIYFKRFHTPLSCRQIALEKGDPFFRQLEKEIILSLKHGQNIIAVGGGAVLNPENAAHLKLLGKMVYLKADKEMIKKRMLSGILPSFIDPEDPDESFENMYQDRKEKYAAIEAKTIDLQSKTEKDVVEELIKLYGK